MAGIRVQAGAVNIVGNGTIDVAFTLTVDVHGVPASREGSATLAHDPVRQRWRRFVNVPEQWLGFETIFWLQDRHIDITAVENEIESACQRAIARV